MILTAPDVIPAAGFLMPVPHLPGSFCLVFQPHLKNGADNMEYIRGKTTGTLDSSDFAMRLKDYKEVLVDLGTGDGRFVQYTALANPQTMIIGVDACRENLVDVSRKVLPNSLFLISRAESLPSALYGLADTITINFPWGSLLEGLLLPDTPVVAGLQQLAKPDASLHLRLNESALQKAGQTLEIGGESVRRALAKSGFNTAKLVQLDTKALRSYPTTWAHRLGYGRASSALYLRANYIATRRLAS
jgi:16S rRNA (adenine(1408)-N(1))-methyltransferase